MNPVCAAAVSIVNQYRSVISDSGIGVVPALNSLKSMDTAGLVGAISRIATWTETLVAVPQVVPVQTYGGPAQSALVVQLFLHAPVPHA